MTRLYTSSGDHRKEFQGRGVDHMDELLDVLQPKMPDIDGRRLLFLKEALRQCRCYPDLEHPEWEGTWEVADETEQRWLTEALTALRQVLLADGWPWEAPPDPVTWMRYFTKEPVVNVVPGTAHVDLMEYNDMVTGQCKVCGCHTDGVNDTDDTLTAADLEQYDEKAAKGDWWCEACWNNRCECCGEKAKAGDDPHYCADCARDSVDDIPATEAGPNVR